MNGIHDMGGMHGMGPIEYDKNEPVFHAPWEARVWALVRAMAPWGRGRWRNTRYELERIPPAEYLRMSYYERWFTVLVDRLLRSNFVTRAELESGKPEPGSSRPTLPEQVARVGGVPQDVQVNPRFKVGQRVRARNINPVGHTRLPRYCRGRRGRIVRDHGLFGFQDTHANGEVVSDKPQHVYTVHFTARELWGQQASPRDGVYVDFWEDYLERA